MSAIRTEGLQDQIGVLYPPYHIVFKFFVRHSVKSVEMGEESFVIALSLSQKGTDLIPVSGLCKGHSVCLCFLSRQNAQAGRQGFLSQCHHIYHSQCKKIFAKLAH